MTRAARIWGRVLASAALAVLLGGCASDPAEGYSFARTHDPTVRSVAVPIFENLSEQPGMEALLTEAVIKRIQARTGWRVTSPDLADTTLTGSISSSRYNQLSRTRGVGLAQELSYRLTVDIDWRDARSGETLVSRRGMSATSTFIADIRVGERRDVGEFGAIEELADAIVDELQSRW